MSRRPTYKPWLNRSKLSRRRMMVMTGTAGLGAAGLALVGCGDDDDEAISQAITQVIEEQAEQAQAQVTEEEQVAQVEQAAEEMGQAAEEAGVDIERDLIVAQNNLFVSQDQDFSNIHETQEANVAINNVLIRNPIIEKQTAGGRSYFSQDSTGPWEPMLATDFTLSEDGLVYEFTLREGAISYNGNELTADDVVYTYAAKVVSGGIGQFVSDFALEIKTAEQVVRVDDRTVQFHLSRPYPTFVQGISNHHAGAILDSTVRLEHATEDDPFSTEWATTNSNGFGAYKIESFIQGEQAVFVANENYVRGSGVNPPAIKKMIWRVVPESANRLALVRRGDVHIAKQMLAREQLDAETEEGIAIPFAEGNLSFWISTNLDKEQWNDTRSRQAFTYALPYDEVIDTVYRGKARREFGMVPDDIPGSAPQHWEKYVQNFDIARELLAQAGVPDGFSSDLAFELNFPDSEENAILIRNAVANVGIDLNLVGLTPAASTENRVTREKRQPAFLTRDYAIVKAIPYYLHLFFLSEESIINWSAYFPGRANYDEFEAALQAGIGVGDDLAQETLDHYGEAQRVLADDSPMQWMAWTDPQYIWRDNLSGFYGRSDNLIDYGEVAFTA